MGAHAHLYDRQWRKRRAEQLRDHPLCKLHMDMRGEVRAATVADHCEPHRGDVAKFAGPLQSLCATCHNTWKKATESGNLMKGCDLNGRPIDPRHPFHAAGNRGAK